MSKYNVNDDFSQDNIDNDILKNASKELENKNSKIIRDNDKEENLKDNSKNKLNSKEENKSSEFVKDNFNDEQTSSTDENNNLKSTADSKNNDDEIKRSPVKNSTIKTKKKNYKTIKIVAASAISLIVLATAGYGIYVNSYSNIMPNTYIENINLGGLTQEEAAEKLSQEYDQNRIQGKTLKFICMGDQSTIDIKNLSMQFEPEKMASDAFQVGRTEAGFFNKLKSYTSSIFSGSKVRPAVSYDEQALTGAINDLCAPHEIEPLGYTFRIGDNNDIVIAKPQDGIKVDMESAIQLVIDQICSFNFGDIEFIPIKTKAPELDLDDFYNYITKPAEDASYAKDDNNKVYVVPGKPQIVVNKSEIKAAIEQPEDDYSIPVQLVNPAVDTEFLQSILYEDTLGTYTTDYSGSSAARAGNIRLASNTINGLELLPGEKFDFNDVVGKRSPDRGYQQAPVYVVKEGKTVSEVDYGGGICQVSSTLFCAINRAGLDVIARTSHSKDVAYVPKGMDATVSWGGPEFIFKNSTNYPVRILIDASGGVLSVRVVGSNVSKPKINLDVQNDGNSITVIKTTTSSDGSTTQETNSSKTPPTKEPSSQTTASAEPQQ